MGLLALNRPPVLQSVPTTLLPYLVQIRHEPEFRAWLIRHQATQDPLGDFIQDGTASVKNRQRAWQFREKLR
jgi:uncharacterized membrane protein YbaN (DUF454 family)